MQMRQKLGKEPEVQELFIGTKTVPPALFIANNAGFDAKYCSNGQWGNAFYMSVLS
jgi:hypothetical protein